MEREIIDHSINRLEQMGVQIFEAIEESMSVEMSGVEYYLTACKNSIRKEYSTQYKGKRKPNKWVNKIRKELLEGGFCKFDDRFEADDQIVDRAKELGVDNCIIVSIDKDLRQREGLHFDYYKVKDYAGDEVQVAWDHTSYFNEDGLEIATVDTVDYAVARTRRTAKLQKLDDYGNAKKRYRGPLVVSKSEAHELFWKQVLMGDSGDNISGVKGIGPKKANDIFLLADPEDYKEVVKEEYLKWGKKRADKEISDFINEDEDIDCSSYKESVYSMYANKAKKEFELAHFLIYLGCNRVDPYANIES